MVTTIVTHMMISLNNHVGRAPNTNVSFKKVATIQQFENVTEVKYKSAIEQSQLPQAGPQTFQYNLNEPAKSIGDGLTRQALKVRTFSETKSISEALVKKVTHLLAETKTISDGLTEIDKKVRTLSEPAKSVSELLVRIAKQVETIPETTTISEGLAASRKFTEAIATETTTISSSVVKVAKKVKSIVESQINITEALVHVRVAGLSESPVSVSEALAAARVFTKVLTEKTTISGSKYSYQPASFTTASFINAPYLSEHLARSVIHPFSQTISITESFEAHKQKVRASTENVPVGLETLARLVNHLFIHTAVVTESLNRIKRPQRDISETTTIGEALAAIRHFNRMLNPISYLDSSFTTDSFNIPSQDIVTLTEELEGFALGQGVRNLLEPSTDISESLALNVIPFNKILPETVIIAESLDVLKIPVPVVSTPTRVGSRRRMRRYRTFLRSLQPIKPPYPIPEPEHEPLTFEIELSDSPTMIQESLTAVKIISEKEIVSVAAAAPPPQIIEKEVEKIVYVDRIVEKEVLIEPPPIIQAEPILISKPQPIETNQEILVSTQSHSNRMKSRAASAKLHLLEKLKMLTEMEELI